MPVNPKVFTEEALANLKIYNELKTIYEGEGVNQQTHQFLNRISQRKIRENDNLNKVPLMQLLSNACKTMMLSEFEIAAWASWLDKLELIDESEYKWEDYVLFTAFYIKMSLNDEDYLNDMFQSFFNWYIRGFIVKFNNWLKNNKNMFQFNPIEVNKKFKELNKPFNPQQDKDFIDYNHWVDDILQISPPYNYWGDKEAKSKAKPFDGGMNGTIQFDSSLLSASQKSIVPTKKKILTIPADASQHQINWNPTINEEDLDKNTPPLTRLAKKKSSLLSIKDIGPSIKPLDDEGLFKKSSNISNINYSQLNNLYNLNEDKADNLDMNLDGIFLNSNNPKITKSIPRRPNVPTGKSFSGFSNVSNSNDFNNNKSSQMQADNQALLSNLQSSFNLVKIPVGDFSRFDIDEKQLDNLPDIPNISSRGNSFQQLLRNDPTPALFRGGSSIIDPRFIKKN